VHLLELAEAERGGHPGGWILEVVARQPDLLVMLLLEMPNPPSSCDSCKRMSTQARSCWFNVL
jgi:hypothetical protein